MGKESSSKSEKLSSKKKKEKKSKKSKKHRKRSSSTSSSESSGNEWVEKGVSEEKRQQSPQLSMANIQRDEWMSVTSLIPCVTREQLRAAKEPTKKQLEAEERKKMLDCPGQSGRELNPYWANGGKGLPPEAPGKSEETARSSTLSVMIGNSNWYKKALHRAKEQAEEEGRALEEVAAERWGSLDKLLSLIDQAEKQEASKAGGEDRRYDRRDRRFGNNDKRYDRNDKRYDRNEKRYDRNEKRYDRNEKRYDREERRYDRGEARYGRNEKYGWEEKRHNRDGTSDSDRKSSPPKFRKPGSDEDKRSSPPRYQRPDFGEDRRSSPSRFRRSNLDEDRRSSPPKFRKPDFDDGDRRSSPSRSRRPDLDDERKRDRKPYRDFDNAPVTSKPRFQKPSDSEETSERANFRNPPSGSGNWRKKDSAKPAESKLRIEEELKRNSPSPQPSVPSDSDSEPEMEEKQQPQVLSDAQLNELAAKLVKAEILGNDSFAADLKHKLELARETRKAQPAAAAAVDKKGSNEEVVVLSRTDSKGFSRPLQTKGAVAEPYGGRRRKQKVDTHGADGQRARYFPDDDNYSLQEMFQKEKATTVEDDREMFVKLAGKDKRGEHDLDMDDVFAERARECASDGKLEAKERDRAIREHKRMNKALDNCPWCFDNKSSLKNLIISIGSVSYVCLPAHESLTEGHCLVAPIRHVSCATQLDEDVWLEMQDFRKALVKMFSDRGDDCVWFESAMHLHRQPHMVWNCVPVPRESGDVAPIYFKKAILECETEWSTNKKLVDLGGRDVRKAVPKGLPYFAVDFGMQSGFAHVIEDEKEFPTNFAQEIIGGMLELEHNAWRKPRRESFEVLTKKVNTFIKEWTPYDITKKGKKRKKERSRSPSSSSSSSD